MSLSKFSDNCNVVGNSLSGSCNWSAEHSDIHKYGFRHGTLTATLNGNVFSGELLEKTAKNYKWTWKPPHKEGDYVSKMSEGAKWPFSVERKKYYSYNGVIQRNKYEDLSLWFRVSMTFIFMSGRVFIAKQSVEE